MAAFKRFAENGGGTLDKTGRIAFAEERFAVVKVN
jgi:hypothetical protein